MTGMEICSSARERQRVEHLVLGRPRPKAGDIRISKPRGMPKGEWKVRRAALITAATKLQPGIEAQVVLHEQWGGSQGTPETRRHAAGAGMREGSLARLHRSGAIDAAQLAAAEEIAGMHAAIAADVNVRTASLETRIDAGRRGGGAAFETFAQIRRERAYTDWRQALGGDAALVLAMVVEDLGVTIAAARYGTHVRRAKRRLISALDLWIYSVSGVRRPSRP